jgi:hypothetical protein
MARIPLLDILPPLRPRRPERVGTCMVCGGAVLAGERHMRHHGARVHARCASYRMRLAGSARIDP